MALLEGEALARGCVGAGSAVVEDFHRAPMDVRVCGRRTGNVVVASLGRIAATGWRARRVAGASMIIAAGRYSGCRMFGRCVMRSVFGLGGRSGGTWWWVIWMKKFEQRQRRRSSP